MSPILEQGGNQKWPKQYTGTSVTRVTVASAIQVTMAKESGGRTYEAITQQLLICDASGSRGSDRAGRGASTQLRHLKQRSSCVASLSTSRTEQVSLLCNINIRFSCPSRRFKRVPSDTIRSRLESRWKLQQKLPARHLWCTTTITASD